LSAPRRRLAWIGLAFAAVAIYCALRFSVTTDITDFLDAPGSAVEGSLSRRLTRSAGTRTMVLSVSAPELSAALAAARTLSERLASDPVVAWASAGPDPDLPDSLRALYFDHRYQMLSERPEDELPARLDDSGLAAAAADLKRQLAGPLGPLVAQVAPADPLLAFPALLRRLQGAGNPPLALRDGGFVGPDGRSAIAFVGTSAPALDSARQAPLLARLEREFDELDAQAGGVLELELSAVQRFAVRAERSIRSDITRISTLSTVGILALLLFALRSPRLIVVGSLPLVAGLLTGLAACLLLYGRVGGLTLAFGGALVGVVIDYPLHLLAHCLAEEDDDAQGAFARVWPGIRLGSATSFVGFAALAGAGFPGIREIGIFAGAGIAGAVVVTALVLPHLVPSTRGGRGSPQARWAAGLARGVERLRARPGAAAAIPALALAVCILGLPGARWTDSVAALSPVDPALAAEETRVRQRVLGPETSRVVIALGADEEQALQRNDTVARRLEALVAEGALDEFRSLHPFLWSADLQSRNLDTFRRAPDLGPRTLAALADQGFRPEAFAAFPASLAESPPPLRLADLLESPIGHWVRPFVLPPDDRSGDDARVALANLVRGVRDEAALADVGSLEGVVYLDQFELLEQGYRGLREAAVRTVGLGVLAVLGLLWLNYRSAAATAVAVLPALLACGTTAGLISLFGVSLNLVHLFGLLLILGMGVDYGVFLAETARQGEPVGATALGLLLSCATSVLGLGLLALSGNPGLRALGVTAAVGVVSSLLLGPAMLAVLDRSRERAGP